MTCRELTDFIMDYLEGELPAHVVAAFERHLARCADCHTYLAHYKATVAAGREAFADWETLVPREGPQQLLQAILATRRR